MRLHRFYISDTIKVGDELSIKSPELINQLTKVLRLGVGDRINLFNGTGFDYECKIDNINGRSTINSNSVIGLSVLYSTRNNNISRRKLFLGAAIVKKDNFEWIVEKATELGVTDIIPIIAERSEKKALNEDRLGRIVTEASEQSGRDTTPMVWPIMGLGSAVSSLKRENFEIKILAFHTEGESIRGMFDTHVSVSNENNFGNNSNGNVPVAVFIGPEGGWTPNEIAMFHKEGVQVVCLGPQILRTETAVVAALSMLVFG